jgi:hypothetical protein
VKCVKSEIRSRTTKIKNRILAIPADAPAIPPKPSAPAINATTKNTKAHYNISWLLTPNDV